MEDCCHCGARLLTSSAESLFPVCFSASYALYVSLMVQHSLWARLHKPNNAFRIEIEIWGTCHDNTFYYPPAEVQTNFTVINTANFVNA